MMLLILFWNDICIPSHQIRIITIFLFYYLTYLFCHLSITFACTPNSRSKKWYISSIRYYILRSATAVLNYFRIVCGWWYHIKLPSQVACPHIVCELIAWVTIKSLMSLICAKQNYHSWDFTRSMIPLI